MNHVIYGQGYADRYPIAVLVPVLAKDEVAKYYLDPFGIPKEEVLGLSIDQEPDKKKNSVAFLKKLLLETLCPVFRDQQTKFLVVGDGELFKVLTGVPKVDAIGGYVLPVKQEYGYLRAVYVPNYRQAIYDPAKVLPKIAQGMNAMIAYATGTYQPPGCDIIQASEFPDTLPDIKRCLDEILARDCDVVADIEAFSLKAADAGVGTITLCVSKTEGIAFAIDYEPIPGATEAPYGRQVVNHERRKLLVDFLYELHKRKRKIIFHNIAYDASAMIYALFMDGVLDTEGLLEGMKIMLTYWDCTMLITYLATNSTAGNKLGLKDQAQAYAGNWAVEVKDITRIPIRELLQYCLIDGLSTFYVLEKNKPIMIADDQNGVYMELFQPALLDIVQMQLTGMPLNMQEVRKARKELEFDETSALDRISLSQLVKDFEYLLTEEHVNKRNQELKNKRITMADEPQLFNPNSDPQLQKLLFGHLQLPIIELTESKQPATGNKVLANLKNHTTKPDVLALLDALLDFKSVNKILTSFIPAMEGAVQGKDGWHYLMGYFKLGGTVSGRLSSNNPNLQNLPANSKYAKVIKRCFQAPPGWMFVGLDFASLEDRISALTTKDPNKLKVYTEGYDGHAMRAVAYWPESMPEIDINDVTQVNAIAVKGHKYATFRQDSKAPTFALTYQGTYITLMKNCGFTKEKAQGVEANFRKLYARSIEWVNEKLTTAQKVGYVTVAFGLRVRTPLLHQTIRGTSKTPYAAEAEGRTAGNALGQSWCLLNSRAASEFMGKVRASRFRLDIRPCAHIHDAQYYLVREDMAALLFMNEHLVKAVNWNHHPDIYHPDVGLGGEVGIFFPNWSNEITIPNGADEATILEVIEKNLAKLAEKGKK